MKMDEAHWISKSGLIWRQKDDGLLLFHAAVLAEHVADNGKGVQQGFYTQIHNGKVRKLAGVRLKDYDDWKSCTVGSNEHTIFVERHGEPPGEGSAGWTKAVGASPVNVAMRRDKDGVLMIRRSKDRTWRQVPVCNSLVLLRQGFRHYSGWEPMPADHPLANSPWNEERIPFRDPLFPPDIPPEEVEEWARTGSSPALKALREQDRRISPETIPLSEQLRDRAELIRVAKANPPCLEVDTVIDEPAPEVLSNIGTMTEALASSIRSMVEIGESETAKELALQLKHLVGNASWLLRNDRTERAKQRVNGQ